MPQNQVLALDADSPRTGHALELLADHMRDDGLRPVVVASGRPGHRHLFVRLPDEAARTRYLTYARNATAGPRPGPVELDDRSRKLIRSPLTPSWRGDPVALIGMTAAEAAAALEPSPAQQQYRALLRDGDPDEPDRSAVEWRVLRAAVAAGETAATSWQALTLPTNRGGAKTRARLASGRAAARREHGRAFRKAAASVHREQASLVAVRARILDMAAAGAVADWGGPSADSIRTTYLALACCAYTAGRTHNLGASWRRLAEMTNTAADTTGDALHALVDAGSLIVETCGAGTLDASTYTLLPPPKRLLTCPDAKPLALAHGGLAANRGVCVASDRGLTEALAILSSDLLSGAGIGKGPGWLLLFARWGQQVGDPLAADEYAAGLHRTGRTVSRRWETLAAHGLAAPDGPDSWRLTTGTEGKAQQLEDLLCNLDAAAAALPDRSVSVPALDGDRITVQVAVLGTLARRRHRHGCERRAHHAALERGRAGWTDHERHGPQTAEDHDGGPWLWPAGTRKAA